MDGAVSETQGELSLDACPECGHPIAPESRWCRSCEADVGFPNVRAALAELSQLDLRARAALEECETRGCKEAADRFLESISESSFAVVARNGDELLPVLKSDRALVTWHRQVSAGARDLENNRWDAMRTSHESRLFPGYHEEISFAVLSLQNRGLTKFGSYFLQLRTPLIHKRASVFEENPFRFFAREANGGGGTVPAGYRATWDRRGTLALAKLGSRVADGMGLDDFQSLLMSPSNEDDPGDFVEVHIYGRIARTAIESIALGALDDLEEDDLAIRIGVLAAARKAGIAVLEDPAC